MPFGVQAYNAGVPYQQLLDYVGGTNAIYIGWADPGIATSSPYWRIQKLTYDTNNNVTTVKFANKSLRFDQTWDNRTTYTYS